jgi:hypothetical protein
MATATVPAVSELEGLRHAVRNADVTNDEVFHQLFRQCQMTFGLSDQAAADALKVTRPTVNRWANGQNLPHRALRSHLLTWMDKELSRRIKLQISRGGNSRAFGASLTAKSL